jgi:hypothetical protein
LFFALVRPVPDFVRVREFFHCLELITSSCFGWLVRDARVTSTHALKGQLVQGVEVPSDAFGTLGPAVFPSSSAGANRHWTDIIVPDGPRQMCQRISSD